MGFSSKNEKDKSAMKDIIITINQEQKNEMKRKFIWREVRKTIK